MTLDSRSLRFGDCYAQSFPVASNIAYFVTTAGATAAAPTVRTGANVIAVREAETENATSRYHTVIVRKGTTGLAPEPSKLEITVGDIVVWHTQDQALAGFAVLGEDPKFGVNSLALSDGAFYTHVFGVPGVYRWIDANGEPLGGVVEVTNPVIRSPDDHARWLKVLEQPASFEISGTRVTPDRVAIQTGQTVFWKIDSATGISITDASVVRTPT